MHFREELHRSLHTEKKLSDSYRMQHAQVITESALQQLPHDRPTTLHFMSS